MNILFDDITLWIKKGGNYMKRFYYYFFFSVIIFNISALDVIEKIPSETRFFARFDLKTLRQNSFYMKLQDQNKEQLNFFSAIFALMSGINIDDINLVYLLAKGQDDGFILLDGNFHIDRIKQIVSMNKTNQVLNLENVIFAAEIPDNKNHDKKNLAVIIDNNTILIGNHDRVVEFINVINGKGTLMDEKRINVLKEEYLEPAIFHLSVIELPSEMLENQVLKNFSAAELKADLNDGLLINIKIFMIDSQIAKATEQIINGVVVYLKRVELQEIMDETAKILKNEILETITAQSNGDEVLLKTKIKENALERIIEIQRKKIQIPGATPAPSQEKKDNNDVFDTEKN